MLRLYPATAAEQWLCGLNPHLGDRRPVKLAHHGLLAESVDVDEPEAEDDIVGLPEAWKTFEDGTRP